MISLDNKLLNELGLGVLDDQDKDALLKQMRETLELNVGTKLAERLSEEQLNEFGALADQNDADGALRWLQTNCPDYQQVVAAEFEHLKAEVARSVPTILASVQQ